MNRTVLVATVAGVALLTGCDNKTEAESTAPAAASLTGSIESWTDAVCNPSMYFPGKADSKGFVSMHYADTASFCGARVQNSYVNIGHYSSRDAANADLECNFFGTYVQARGEDDGDTYMIAVAAEGDVGEATLQPLLDFGFVIKHHKFAPGHGPSYCGR